MTHIFKRTALIAISLLFGTTIMPAAAPNTPDINRDLRNAAKLGQEGDVYNCIIAGADIDSLDSRDPESGTALMLAAENGHLPIVRMLMEHGANPDTQNNNGFTALMKAILSSAAHLTMHNNETSNINNYELIIDVLLLKGANTTLTNKQGWTAAHLAEITKKTIEDRIQCDEHSALNPFHPILQTQLAQASKTVESFKYIELDPVKFYNNSLAQVLLIELPKTTDWLISDEVIHKYITALITRLIKCGANISAPAGADQTLLMLAIEHQNCAGVAAMKALLKNGANPNAENMGRRTALIRAVKKHNKLTSEQENGTDNAKKLTYCTKMIMELLQAGANPYLGIDSNGMDALDNLNFNVGLYTSLIIGNLSSIQKLLATHLTQLNQELVDTILESKLKEKHMEIIRAKKHSEIFLDLETQKKLSELETTLKKSTQKFAELIERGANLNEALLLAANKGIVNAIKPLLDHGAQINSSQYCYTPLMEATLEGHTSTAQILIANGAHINQQTEHGETTLILAAQNGRTEIVNLLLQNRVDTTLTEYNGKTALMIAQENGFFEIAEILIRHDQANSEYPLQYFLPDSQSDSND